MAELTIDECEQVETLLDENGILFSLREDYSGRGMYGEICIGFVCDDPYDLIHTIETGLSMDHPLNATYFTMDSMGLSIIVYWPYLKLQVNENA